MTVAWKWARACAVGRSHEHEKVPCQDFAICRQLPIEVDRILVATVSDGAGSAKFAEAGSKLACVGFQRAARRHFLEMNQDFDAATDDVVRGWVEGIRGQIRQFAERNTITPRDCAATLVGVVAGQQNALIVHIGDGVAVVREKSSKNWEVPSWPFHGEYASTTAFITDEPLRHCKIVRLSRSLDRIALLSDGLERLVLDFATQRAFAPFFERMFAPFKASSVLRHDHILSRQLKAYLASPSICERTDDDKTLLLGVLS